MYLVTILGNEAAQPNLFRSPELQYSKQRAELDCLFSVCAIDNLTCCHVALKNCPK